MKESPRVLFVGRPRLRLPLPEWLARKWDAVGEVIDYRLVGAAEPGSPTQSHRFRLSSPARPSFLDGVLFHLRLPFRVRREIDEFRPSVIVAGDPYVGSAVLAGRALARSRVPVVVEVHGDWGTFTRGYGSRARRLLSPLTDRVAVFAVRRADATRALSQFTSDLIEGTRGRPASVCFPTYSDLGAFAAKPIAPLPDQPTAVFVGMLEAYKNIDGMAAAWRRVAVALPDAVLIVVGKGARRHVVEALVQELPQQVEYHEELPPEAVADALDRSTVLVLPSWPEGLGRVVIEAFARGRGVVATGAGGVLDLVTDEVQGILIPPADTDALVTSLIRVLSEPELASRFGDAAREAYAGWHQTPSDFAAKTRALVDSVLAGDVR